jgi:Tol biopolymer transport system component
MPSPSRQVPRSLAVVAALAVLSGCATAAPEASPTVEPPAAQDLIALDAVLGFQWVAESGDAIYTTRVDGTERAQLTDFNGSTLHPDWSPDGTRVAFRLSPSGGRPDQVWVTDADGSSAKLIEACDDGDCAGADYPAWSPDGASLAYTVYRAPLSDELPPSGSVIRVVDVATSEYQDVVASEPGEILDQPRWSPDGTMFALQIDHFEADGTETAMFLAVSPTTGGAVTRLTPGEMYAGYPDWNPVDGRIVFCTFDLTAFATLEGDAVSNLYTINADGSGLTPLTDNTAADLRVSQPSWTLDGSAVLVTIDGNGARTAGIVDGAGGDAVSLGGDGATHVRQVPTG